MTSFNMTYTEALFSCAWNHFSYFLLQHGLVCISVAQHFEFCEAWSTHIQPVVPGEEKTNQGPPKIRASDLKSHLPQPFVEFTTLLSVVGVLMGIHSSSSKELKFIDT